MSSPPIGYFQGDRLELVWRYAYRPEFVPLLIHYMGAQSARRILEVGCGTGFLSRLLAKTLDNVQIDGLDANENSLSLGRKLLERDSLSDRVTLQQGNAYELPFEDETFDLVTSQTLLCILSNPAGGLGEQMRVVRRGGTVSAIACFCHTGNLPHYHGRYLATNNHRVDQLALKLERVFRITIRPELLGFDHSVLSLDLLWQFINAGLLDVQINGHLTLVSPGDARIPIEEGAAYAIACHQLDLERLETMRTDYRDQLATDGFSPAEFDELIALKQARLQYLQEDHARVREMMEVFNLPLMIIRGTRPISS